MLRELHISGLGVIDDLDLPLHPGLNVLTGETGAGKTMITVGISLALGARASASLVREGAAAARVQALFDVADDPSRDDRGTSSRDAIDDWVEDGEVLLARTIAPQGKGSFRIGGQLATASALAAVGAGLVELHGQHQAQRLLEPAVQTAFLDRFAGDEHLVALASYRQAYDELRATTAALEDLRDASRDRERELDLLAYQVREIEAVMPEAGESPGLIAEEARLGHVERLLERSGEAEAALTGDEGAAVVLGLAARALDDARTVDATAGELASRGSVLAVEMVELARDVRSYRESLVADPERLQQVRERISALKGLQRKYGESDADVVAFLAGASSRLAELEVTDDRLAALVATAEKLHTATASRAAVVTSGREVSSARLAAAIGSELHELGMPGAVVEVVLDRLPEPGAAGAERVVLRFASGTAATPRPLAATASGGELSRTMLACRSVLADLDEVPTVVFDEVDAGIGGRAGLAVGRRLAQLANDRQVIVVTHLPQIACFADRHVLVTKHRGAAAVEVLDDDARVHELSRMLSGLDESPGAVTHAEELLHEAGRAAGST